MDIANLQAFSAVAEQTSFSAAAERLFLTQPAVSKRIAQLESELGAKLFDRIGRKVSLTEAGKALLPRARRLLNDAAEIQRTVANLSSNMAGRLSMATSHHIGLHRLPAPLKAFTQQYPQVELDIHFMDSEAACHAVEIGDLELAIVTLPTKPLANLTMQTIWHDPLTFVVGHAHPLSEKSSLALKTVVQHPAVLPNSNTYTRDILQQAVQQAQLTLNIGMETNYLETLGMLVGAGLGWSLLPETLCDHKVTKIKVRGLQLSRQLGAVTHAQRSLSNAAKRMVALCCQTTCTTQ